MKTDVDFSKYFVQKVRGLVVEAFEEGVEGLLLKEGMEKENQGWERKMGDVSILRSRYVMYK